MRYVVIFFDRTTKRVSESIAKAFMKAQMTGDPVLHRGNTYSGKTIASVRTLLGFYQDKVREAGENNQYFCKYGYMHDSRIDCGCRDAGFDKILTAEELVLLPKWNDDAEEKQALLLSTNSR